MKVLAIILGGAAGMFGVGVGGQLAIAGTNLPSNYPLVSYPMALACLVAVVLLFRNRVRPAGIVLLVAGLIWLSVAFFGWRPLVSHDPVVKGINPAAWQSAMVLGLLAVGGGIFGLLHSFTYKPPPPAAVWRTPGRPAR